MPEMKPMKLLVLFALAVPLAAGASPATDNPLPAGYGMKILYEPLPGVPLAPARVAPLPEVGLVTQLAGAALPFRAAVEPDNKRSGAIELRAAGLPVDVPNASVGEQAALPANVLAAGIAPAVPGEPGDAIPNLVFYTPTGWDYPIVPSDVRNTHTVGPDLNDQDTTFFDFAVINNGSATAKPRFYTYLYWDGHVFAGFQTESLPAGYYTYYSDFPWMMPGGAHTILGFTDSTAVIAESLENDNRWSRSYTWRVTGLAKPNLRPYAPAGWSYAVVPSDVRGTHTVGPDLNDFDTTFVDWAVLNDGNATARPTFYVYLYVDATVASGWYVDSLEPYHYVYADDDPNFVLAGNHTLGLVADSTNAVSESNEADNRFSQVFNWRHDAATLPNLTWYVPDTSWDGPLVASSVRGTHKAGPNLTDRDTTFVDWCIVNYGNYRAAPRFYLYLYHDGAPFAGWYLDSLNARTYTYLQDDDNIFPAGTHTLAMFVDSTNAVAESNESDNRYSRQFTWQHVAVPDLVPYQPGGWDYPIVPSNVRNTRTVGPDLNDLDTTFIDWAVANQGSATAKPRFYTYLYQDGTPFAGWFSDSLQAGFYVSVDDYARFVAQGSHTLALYTDSTNAVAESLENNNRWSHSFDWRHNAGAQPNLTWYTPTGWDYPIVPSNVRGTHTVGPDLNDADTTFVDMAFANAGRATAKPRFYIYLYSDGTPFSGWYADSLLPASWAAGEDDARMFTAGDHLLAMFVDSTNTVAESLENDNRWSRTYNWRHYTAVEEPPARGPVRAGLALLENPVRDRLALAVALPEAGRAEVAIYDAAGSVVAVPLSGECPAGVRPLEWDCAGLAGGSYFAVLRAEPGRVRVARFTKLP